MNFRPSNLHRRKSCPGSGRLEAQFAAEPDSEYAVEGRLLHGQFAQLDIEADRPPRDLTEEQCGILLRAIELQCEVFSRVEAECSGFERQIDIEEDEIPFYASLATREIRFTGTPDRVRLYGPAVANVVIDAKFGRNEVAPAEVNYQLAAYAVMAHDRYPTQHVYCAIVQPRAPRESRLTVAKYSAGDIESIRAAVLQIIIECEAPNAPLVPSEDACRYCAARMGCPALLGGISTLATVRGDVHAVAREMQIGELGRLADCVKLAKSDTFGAVILGELKRRIEENRAPGWKLKDNGANSEITDAKAAYNAIAGALPAVTADDFMSVCDVPITGLRKLVQTKLPVPEGRDIATEAAAKTFVNETLGALIQRTKKAASPVREKGEV
jgi:hypothetical protein